MCPFLVLISLIAYFIDCILYVICHAMIRLRMHCNWRGAVHPPYRRLTYSAFQAVWANLLLTAVHPPYVQRVNSGATGRFNFHLIVALHPPYVQRVNSGATGRLFSQEQPLPGCLISALRRAVTKNMFFISQVNRCTLALRTAGEQRSRQILSHLSKRFTLLLRPYIYAYMTLGHIREFIFRFYT